MAISAASTLVYLVSAVFAQVAPVEHERSLIWGQRSRSADGLARMVAVSGDPLVWVRNRTAVTRYITAPNSAWDFTALTHDYRRHTLFWAERDGKKIQAIELGRKGRHPRDIYTGTSGSVSGLAADWLNGNIYWCDTLYDWIALASSDSSRNERMRTVVTNGLDNPTSVAVHPFRRLLFWSDFGQRPKIEKSDLIGNERVELVVDDIFKPISITIDYTINKLLWLDAITEKVEMIDYDGGQRQILVEMDSGSYQALTLSPNFLFITERNQLQVFNREQYSKEISFLSRQVDLGPIIFYDDQHSEHTGQGSCQALNCSDMCISGQCMCGDNRELNSGGEKCQDSKIFQQPQIVYSIGQSLCHFQVNFGHADIGEKNLESQCFLSDRKGITALAADSNKRRLYFSEHQTKSISAMDLDGKLKTDVIVGGTGRVESLGIDWIAQNLYWTDSDKKHIGVCKTNGQFQKVLISGLDHPQGLAVDVVNKVLYWSDTSPNGGLYFSTLHGTDVEKMNQQKTGLPLQLTIDMRTSRLYWHDSVSNDVKWKELGSQEVKTIHQEIHSTVTGIAIFRDFLYLTGKEENSGIYATLRESGERIRSVLHPGDVFSVTMYDTDSQPTVDNTCLQDDNNCQQLCFPTKTGHECGCSYGFIENINICKPVEPRTDDFLLFTDTYHKQIYQMSLESLEITALSPSGSDNPISIDYDPVDRAVYWTDVGTGKIMRSFINKTHNKEETLIDLGSDSIPDGIALDYQSRLLFYTDTGKNIIGVVTLDSKLNTVLVRRGLDQPRAIAVDPSEGRMYWSDWGLRSGISLAYMDGTHRQVLVDTGIGHWPNGLTLDRKGHVIYWCDARSDQIQSIDLVTKERKVLLKQPGSHFFGVTNLGNDIYYSDWTTNSIMKLQQAENGYKPTTIGPEHFARVNDIHAYKSTLNGQMGSPLCARSHPCSQICLPTPSGFTCACSRQYQLDQDKSTCVIKPEFETRNPHVETTSLKTPPTAITVPITKRSKVTTTATKRERNTPSPTTFANEKDSSSTLTVPSWLLKYRAPVDGNLPVGQRTTPEWLEAVGRNDEMTASTSTLEESTFEKTSKRDKEYTTQTDELRLTSHESSFSTFESRDITTQEDDSIDYTVTPSEIEPQFHETQHELTKDLTITGIVSHPTTSSYPIHNAATPSTTLFNPTSYQPNGSIIIHQVNESHVVSSASLPYLALGAVLATGVFLMIFIIVIATVIYKKCVRKSLLQSTSAQRIITTPTEEPGRPHIHTVANYNDSYSIPLHTTRTREEIEIESHLNNMCAFSEFDSDFDDDVTEIDYIETSDTSYGVINTGFSRMEKTSSKLHYSNANDPTFVTFLQTRDRASTQNSSDT